MDMYEKINAAMNHVELSQAVEEYLDSVNQNNSGETYEETAERLREQGMAQYAEVMDAASDKWAELEN